MGLQCNNIEALRVALKNGCEEEKPNGQIKHQFENCVINTYDTGSVVIQDNSKDKNIEQQIKNLVQSINDLNINSCDKK
jgi:ribonuclease HIII